MKKLLLCIGISILITSFIGTTFLFVQGMDEYMFYILAGYKYNNMSDKDIQKDNISNKMLNENDKIEEDVEDNDVWEEAWEIDETAEDNYSLNNMIESDVNTEVVDNMDKIEENTVKEEKTLENYKLEGKSYDYVVGDIMEKRLSDFAEQYKEENEEDFPAVGYIVSALLLYYQVDIIRVYLISIISGIIIGSIVYLLFIKKLKGKKIIIIFALFFTMFFLLIRGLEVCDNILMNIADGNKISESVMSNYQYGITEIFIGYAIIFVIICIVCTMRQKIIAKRLNKELNK